MVPANDSQSVIPAIWRPSSSLWCCAVLNGAAAAGQVMVWRNDGTMPFRDCECITNSSLLVLLDDQGYSKGPLWVFLYSFSRKYCLRDTGSFF